MKVGEVIERLKRFNPDFEVMIEGAAKHKLEYREIVEIDQPKEEFDFGRDDLVIISPDLDHSMVVVDNT